MRKLKNLNPKWLGVERPNSGEGLSFDCPVCENEKSHSIVIYFENPLDGGPCADWVKKGPHWQRAGDEFARLSVQPSIKYPCFHGWLEIGRVFSIKESPIIVVAMMPGGRQQPMALSPLQTIAGCGASIERAKVMLGDGRAGDDAPAHVVKGKDGFSELFVGDILVRTLANGEEAENLARQVNIFFGYLPDEPLDVGRIEVESSEPEASRIVLPG
jgi:hypothetical protein